MVISSRKSRKSASVLEQKLTEIGYNGKTINWGFSGSSKTDVLNTPKALRNAVNKRVALEMLDDEDIPTLLIDEDDGFQFPVVGRPDLHSMGRHMYICWDAVDVRKAKHKRRPATHFQKYLEDFREFRVHIVNGESIKISEKVGGGNYHLGAYFEYPQDFKYMKSLRNLAKQGVEALDLDFGAVDIIWKDKQGYILECNTAPRLTDERSDTLARYVDAFVRNYGN